MTSSVLSSSAPATCFDVTGLTLDSVTTTSANISWTAAAGETAWEIAVQAAGTGTPGAADNSGTDTTTNPHTQGGLTAATAYEVYVRAQCAQDDLSNWVGPVNFTTLAPSRIYFTQQPISVSGWDLAVVDMDGDFLDDIVGVSAGNINVQKQKLVI